jgi:hypothetical protein
MRIIRKKIALVLTTCILIFSLTSCVKLYINLDINSNGSGTEGYSIGLSKQAQSLMNSSDISADTRFDDLLNSDSNDPAIQVSKWTDGDYDWAKYQRDFSSPEQINQAFSTGELFTRFSLTQNHGFFQNQIILDAELAPIEKGEEASDDLLAGMDITTILDVRFSVHMPGKILTTNGLADINDPNLLVWSIRGKEPVSVQAKSVTWNWVNIAIVFGGAFLVVVIIVTVVLINKSRKVRQLQTITPAAPDQVDTDA